MQPNPTEYPAQLPIELLALYVQRLPLHEKFRLVKLVPELKRIEETAQEPISDEQLELINYFTQKTPVTASEMQSDEILIGGITFDEFLLLPEDKQSEIWNEAYAKAESELAGIELELKSDAIPAR